MGSAKKVDVDVHIIRDSTKQPPYDFWLETKDHNVGKPKGDLLKFANDGKYDGFDLRFHVVDETGEGFLFMDQEYDGDGKPDPDHSPMWCRKVEEFSDPCPHREFWHQFETTEVSKNNATLYVRNHNTDVHKFKFALMFSKTPHQAPFEIMYDPGGENQNGPRPMALAAMTTPLMVFGGAVAGGAIALAAVPQAGAGTVVLGALIGAIVMLGINRLVVQSGRIRA